MGFQDYYLLQLGNLKKNVGKGLGLFSLSLCVPTDQQASGLSAKRTPMETQERPGSDSGCVKAVLH